MYLREIADRVWVGFRRMLRSGGLPDRDNPLRKEHEMPHGSKVNWGGGVKSPKGEYKIRWEVDFEDPPGVKLNAEFTVKHLWKGRHVANELEKEWNDKPENKDKAPAAADGPMVEFAGEVKEMRYNVDGRNHTDVPADHSSVPVVPGLHAFRD